MPAQFRFEVAGVNVEAPADDHVLAAVHQDQKTIVVKAAHVAGANKALARAVEPLDLARFFGLLVVARHHARRAAHHLAHLAGGVRGHLNAVFVDQSDVAGGGGLADGVQLRGVRVRFQNAGAAAFGHAVVLDQLTWPTRQKVGLERGVKRRTGAKLGQKTRQVVVAERGQRHEALVLHRHQHGVCGADAFGQFQIAFGVEPGHQINAAAPAQRREKRHQCGVRIQRRGQQRGAAWPVLVAGRPVDVRPAHAVRLHDALGRAGGAG